MILILEIKTNQTKNPNTKTTYITQNVEKNILTERQYNLTVKDDTLKWFRHLGGTETAQRGYTCYGYVPYKLTSKSPDRELKIVREFNFVALDYKEGEKFKRLFKHYSDGLFYLKRFKRGLTVKQLKEVLKSKTL